MEKLLAFNGDNYLAEEFLGLRDKYGIKTIIETGTYNGDTTLWLSQFFDRVITIEINETYFNEAQERLRGIKNIVMIKGNSPEFLPHLLNSESTMCFLDDHWYSYNPLLDELDIIMKSKVKPKVVVIHDFKVPDHPEFGYDIYPEQNIIYDWNYIKDHIDGYSHYYNQVAEGAKRGCIFLVNK